MKNMNIITMFDMEWFLIDETDEELVLFAAHPHFGHKKVKLYKEYDNLYDITMYTYTRRDDTYKETNTEVGKLNLEIERLTHELQLKNTGVEFVIDLPTTKQWEEVWNVLADWDYYISNFWLKEQVGNHSYRVGHWPKTRSGNIYTAQSETKSAYFYPLLRVKKIIKA